MKAKEILELAEKVRNLQNDLNSIIGEIRYLETSEPETEEDVLIYRNAVAWNSPIDLELLHHSANILTSLLKQPVYVDGYSITSGEGLEVDISTLDEYRVRIEFKEVLEPEPWEDWDNEVTYLEAYASELMSDEDKQDKLSKLREKKVELEAEIAQIEEEL